jgi:hypothetical protein
MAFPRSQFISSVPSKPLSDGLPVDNGEGRGHHEARREAACFMRQLFFTTMEQGDRFDLAALAQISDEEIVEMARFVAPHFSISSNRKHGFDVGCHRAYLY